MGRRDPIGHAIAEVYALPVRSKLNILLRRSRPTDASALRSILYDTFESTWRPNITPAAARAFYEEERPSRYIAKRGNVFWVAECDANVVGFIDWDGDFINALHVRGSHARCGLGRSLLGHAEEEIRKAGLPCVRLETDTFNAASQSFYAGLGYQEADRYPDTEWSSDLTTILFIKSLS